MSSIFSPEITRRLDQIALKFYKKFQRDGGVGDVGYEAAQEIVLPDDFPEGFDYAEALIFVTQAVDKLAEEAAAAESSRPRRQSARLKAAIETVRQLNPREQQTLADVLNLKGSD